MDEYLASSDLCEEHGHAGPAEVLRGLSRRGGTAFAVVERTMDYDDDHYSLHDPDRGSPLVGVYLDRDRAERVALEQNARWLRETNIYEFHEFEDVGLSMDEFHERVGAILGVPFEPDLDAAFLEPGRSPFPADATDEQMLEIARLLAPLANYQVIEVELAG